MQRPKRTLAQSLKDEVKSTHETTDALRSLSQATDTLEADEDWMDAEFERLQAMGECLEAITTFPEGDPRRVKAEARLKRYSSWWWPWWINLGRSLRRLWRTFTQELIYASLLPIKVALVIVFNLAALYLLVQLITWQ